MGFKKNLILFVFFLVALGVVFVLITPLVAPSWDVTVKMCEPLSFIPWCPRKGNGNGNGNGNGDDLARRRSRVPFARLR